MLHHLDRMLIVAAAVTNLSMPILALNKYKKKTILLVFYVLIQNHRVLIARLHLSDLGTNSNPVIQVIFCENI